VMAIRMNMYFQSDRWVKASAPCLRVLLVIACTYLGIVAGARGAAATPADYGFRIPAPDPGFPVGVDSFQPPLLGDANGPEIAEWTRSGGPGNAITLAGPDFDSNTRFLVFGQTSAGNSRMFECPPFVVDDKGASFVLPKEVMGSSLYLVWPVTGVRKGLPVAINRTDSWWIGPNEAVVGARVAVYGRNLSRNGGLTESHVYIKSSDGQGRWVTPETVNPYAVEFIVPALSGGAYEVWLHNGHGGPMGWSGPVILTILATDPFAAQANRSFNVKDYGAKGDGVSDDTGSLNTAMSVAAANRPATLYFPAGVYVVNDTLMPLEDITWRGAGRGVSIIVPGSDFLNRSRFPFILSNIGHRIMIRDLSIEERGRMGGRTFIQIRGARHLQLKNVKLDVGASTLDLHGNSLVRISDSQIVGAGTFFGNSTQVLIERCELLLAHVANSAVTFWGGSEVAIVGNTARDLDPSAQSAAGVGTGRFVVSQGHWGALRDFYIGHNRTIALAPPHNLGIDSNQGEQVLFEHSSPVYSAVPISASRESLMFSGSVVGDSALDLVIVKGRGVGQLRRITSVSGNTIRVAPAFRVVPDSSSTIVVTSSQSNSVVYRNTIDGKDDFAKFYSASVGVSLYGSASNTIIADNILTRMRGGIATEFVWLDSYAADNAGGIFFNLVARNQLDGSLHGFYGATVLQHRSASGTIGHFGNTYRSNTVRNLVGNAIEIGLAPAYNSHEGSDFAHIVFEGNQFRGVSPEVAINGSAGLLSLSLLANTFIRDTSGVAVSSLRVDPSAGNKVFLSGNSWVNLPAPSSIERDWPASLDFDLSGLVAPATPSGLVVTPP